MKTNAISIANYFVDKAVQQKETSVRLDLLRLVKYVYIAYGFSLAILKRKIIDERFDKVEAWKYGPVIPSVYHSFKHNKTAPITQKESILSEETSDGKLSFTIPEIDRNDVDLVMVLDFVWNRYQKMSDGKLITTLHHKGTPWEYCYEKGKNNEIYDEYTQVYYEGLFEAITDGRWKAAH